MKIAPVEKKRNSPDFIFLCPGCKCCHGIWTTERNGQNAIWSFNGDMEKPTVSPSILVKHSSYEYGEDGSPLPETVKDMVCHSYVRNGMIEFLPDSTHALAGKTVPLQDMLL
jgi:hypothetical protein